MNNSPELTPPEIAEEGEREEKPLPIALVYRDNELFQRYVPKVAEILGSLGRQVETHVIPRETDLRAIQDWTMKNIQDFNGRLIVSDGTCAEGMKVPLSFGPRLKKPVSFQEKPGYLDEICNRAPEMAVLGKDWISRLEYTGDPAQREKSFREILKRVFENPENIPAQVSVLLPRLADHWGGIRERDNAESEVAEILKRVLAESGLPEDRVSVDEQADSESVREVDRPGNWILADRHFLGWKPTDGRPKADLERLSNARVFYIPMGNFVRSLLDNGLLPPKEEELDQTMREMLEEEFGAEKYDKK